MDNLIAAHGHALSADNKDWIREMAGPDAQLSVIIGVLKGAHVDVEAVFVDEVKAFLASEELEYFDNMIAPPRPEDPPGAAAYVHPKAAEFVPHALVFSADGQNQRTAGQPNGCTEFACAFVTSREHATSEMVQALIHRKDLGIVAGRNADASEVLQKTLGCRLVDWEGHVVDDPMPMMFLDGVVTQKAIARQFRECFARTTVDGFVITTGLESFAVRFREGCHQEKLIRDYEEVLQQYNYQTLILFTSGIGISQ